MRCSICGRKLRNQVSREIGYGPICYKKKYGEKMPVKRKDEPNEKKDAPVYNIPGQMTIFDFI